MPYSHNACPEEPKPCTYARATAAWCPGWPSFISVSFVLVHTERKPGRKRPAQRHVAYFGSATWDQWKKPEPAHQWQFWAKAEDKLAKLSRPARLRLEA